ncbi:hypothetical protein A3I35_03045 [Candidatus Falkowbacteria bacterium RIFCSPLOWO2_02_FULL_45_15]|uniref:Uncharacterized protein n=2 Tax=Candidatus Falkowiibacteriota TaxID=1752728 RepID=A0A1F5RY43_9BACT|nr:MAG: hypothetical protein A3I35_03045 [Candidatus Falkowbacteria bacterium RIFCSPLOWO2_02_FULL_45_15]
MNTTAIISNLIVTIISGLVVAAMIYWFGIGGGKTSVVQIQGAKIRKTGKWIILISALIIALGIKLLVDSVSPGEKIDYSNMDSIYAFGVFSLGVMLFIAGKVITWFQRM